MDYPLIYKAAIEQAIGLIDLEKVSSAIQLFSEARDQERLIFVAGNGGSAATASHFCCDMLKCSSSPTLGSFRMISLVDTVPTLTAYANDVAYAEVFASPLAHMARPGDVYVAFSGSGNSPNVVEGIRRARSLGLRTLAFTGRDGGALGALADLQLHVPVPHMGRIEDVHMIMAHMICYHFVDHPSKV